MDCFNFNKTRRLLKKSDYDYVFEKAQKLVTPGFIILHRANNLGQARLGLALSKKSIPKAHDRNRIKRLLRETFRTRRLATFDVVFLARHGVANVEKKTLTAELGVIWNKLTAFYAI